VRDDKKSQVTWSSWRTVERGVSGIKSQTVHELISQVVRHSNAGLRDFVGISIK
jgi:hypothetical protein